MSEIIKQILDRSKNKDVIIFLKNGFRFEGKVKDSDGSFVLIIDYYTRRFKAINIDNISEIEEVGSNEKEKKQKV